MILCGALREIAEDRSLMDTKGGRDFWRSEATSTQTQHPGGLDFRGPFLAATVDALPLCGGNAGRLTLAALFLFDFR